MALIRKISVKGFVFVVFAFATAFISLLGSAPAEEKLEIKGLPELDFKKCVEIEHVVTRNPLSPLPNDLLFMTKYEERPNSPESSEEILRSRLNKALNVYLLKAVLLPKDTTIGLVRSTFLVVKLSTIPSDSTSRTLDEWIIADENGDEIVDKALFRHTLKDSRPENDQAEEREFPQERMPELQEYYDRAGRDLNRQSESPVGGACEIL